MMRWNALFGLAAASLLAACQPTGSADSVAAAGAEATRISSTDDMMSRSGTPIDRENHPGRALFYENCAGCHSGAVPKAPAIVWLEMLEPDMVLGALNNGVMKQQAAGAAAGHRRISRADRA